MWNRTLPFKRKTKYYRRREKVSFCHIYRHLFSSGSVRSQLVFKEDLGRNGKEPVLVKKGDRLCAPSPFNSRDHNK